jgi:mannitol/fructose-specific phosphotransferase system IIA component (Ntr-type)
MLLGDILHSGVVRTRLEAEEKYAVIRELLDAVIDSGDLAAHLRDDALEALVARERSTSTGMEHGIALPHATLDRIQRVVGALGISEKGIEWDCLDCEPARLVILLLLPREQFRVHVRTLAGVSHLLNDDAFCDALIRAGDAEAILQLIDKEEQSSVFDSYRGPDGG